VVVRVHRSPSPGDAPHSIQGMYSVGIGRARAPAGETGFGSRPRVRVAVLARSRRGRPHKMRKVTGSDFPWKGHLLRCEISVVGAVFKFDSVADGNTEAEGFMMAFAARSVVLALCS